MITEGRVYRMKVDRVHNGSMFLAGELMEAYPDIKHHLVRFTSVKYYPSNFAIHKDDVEKWVEPV